MKFWDDIPWEGKEEFAAMVGFIVLVPCVILLWIYMVRALRYVLDGVLAWVFFIGKIVLIALMVALILFNAYQLVWYSHNEPIASILHWCAMYHSYYMSARAMAVNGLNVCFALYNKFIQMPFF